MDLQQQSTALPPLDYNKDLIQPNDELFNDTAASIENNTMDVKNQPL